MSSSAGRRDAAYLAAKRRFQQGDLPCHHGCGRPGTTPDHDPPLDGTNPALWNGRFLPACQPCQSRQGAAITNAKRAKRRWTW
jgi:hypothetical protein